MPPRRKWEARDLVDGPPPSWQEVVALGNASDSSGNDDVDVDSPVGYRMMPLTPDPCSDDDKSTAGRVDCRCLTGSLGGPGIHEQDCTCYNCLCLKERERNVVVVCARGCADTLCSTCGYHAMPDTFRRCGSVLMCAPCRWSLASGYVAKSHPIDPSEYNTLMNRLWWVAGYSGAVDPNCYNEAAAVDASPPTPPPLNVAGSGQRTLDEYIKSVSALILRPPYSP